jgi:hypothetical protein
LGHWAGIWTGAGVITSVKLFGSQPMAPWTSVAAYECGAAQSMDLLAVTKKILN